MKYITKDNYKEFKPSEFIRSFASDVDVVIRSGKKMNMDAWEDNGCLPCLGGMACLNMGIKWFGDKVGSLVSDLGNDIRVGNPKYIKAGVSYLYPKIVKGKIEFNKFNVIEGKVSGKELQQLKERIHIIADAYEKAGF